MARAIGTGGQICTAIGGFGVRGSTIELLLLAPDHRVELRYIELMTFVRI